MSQPQLYIKGLKEPIPISREEAKLIEGLKVDDSKPFDTPVVIPDVWNGTKSDIRYIAYPPKEKSYSTSALSPMTDTEANLFEQNIPLYEQQAEELGLSKLYWTDMYIVDKGGIQVKTYDIASSGKRSITRTITNIENFEKSRDEIERYVLWKGRQEFIEKKKLEGLEELAEQFTESHD